MVLNTEHREFTVPYAFDGVIIEVTVRDLKFLGT
jgi:hypothetical protein